MIAVIALVLQAGLALAVNEGQLFLQKVDDAVVSGQLTAEEGLLYKFHYAFDQQRLPSEYRPASFSPVKSATPFIREFNEIRDSLSRTTVETIEQYLALPDGGSRVIYYTPEGHFRLNYQNVGGDAVPQADVNPPNGIPDFIERCGEYFEYTWQREVVDQRFTAPPIGGGTYYVNFLALSGVYGYCSPGAGGMSTITMDNNFIGFPPNDDPDGDALGAAKVTAAHEFKHATQYAGSGWSEGGWTEVDATWAEEFVFPATNDYLNYLFGSSNPIGSPHIPLDQGGSGSYEDCVWELFQSQTYTADFITDLWTWRISHTGQPMMDSYEQIFVDYGSSLKEGWAYFTAWNYACGSRRINGLGYEEANRYPTGTLANTMYSFPDSHSGSVQHLAANFIRVIGIGGILGECVVEFDGADNADMVLTAVIKKRNLTGVIERITLDPDNDCNTALSVNLDDIEEIGFVVGNYAKTGSYQSYTITVHQVEDLPDPHLESDTSSINKSMNPDSIGTEYIQLTNNGEEGSVLNYEVAVWDDSPTKGDDKNISGSVVWFETDTYVAGTSATLVVWVTNGSSDEEWLTDVWLDFPPGVYVSNATVFVGGTYGYLWWEGPSGDGAHTHWHGTYGAQEYGVIIDGESAYANINVIFDAGLSGDLEIPYTVTGDGWGSPPHEVYGTAVITQTGPDLELLEPDGGEFFEVGQVTDIEWSVDDLHEVKIELSRNGGVDWEDIAATTPNDGTFSWTVTGPGSINARIKVSSLDGLSTDSSGDFTIFAPSPWLTVAPDQGAINNGDSETLVATFDTNGLANAVYHAWIVINHDGDNSPMIIPVTLTVGDPTATGDTPHAFALDSVFPNPFNPSATIRFALPTESSVVIDVLDLRGFKVRTIVDDQMAAGVHDVQWDGRDDNGQMVAAGTYLARLRADDYQATSKMMLAK